MNKETKSKLMFASILISFGLGVWFIYTAPPIRDQQSFQQGLALMWVGIVFVGVIWKWVNYVINKSET